eukprot:GHVQ01018699.1.p1 GENE.GHVQ01018699.1~~GHVQ01018699.1.p1  ORF type:complete len:109 (+),score=7.20 GHVQ01018699.1:512-838(+)
MPLACPNRTQLNDSGLCRRNVATHCHGEFLDLVLLLSLDHYSLILHVYGTGCILCELFTQRNMHMNAHTHTHTRMACPIRTSNVKVICDCGCFHTFQLIHTAQRVLFA